MQASCSRRANIKPRSVPRLYSFRLPTAGCAPQFPLRIYTSFFIKVQTREYKDTSPKIMKTIRRNIYRRTFNHFVFVLISSEKNNDNQCLHLIIKVGSVNASQSRIMEIFAAKKQWLLYDLQLVYIC